MQLKKVNHSTPLNCFRVELRRMLFGAKDIKYFPPEADQPLAEAKESIRKGGAQSYPDVPAELEAGTPM